MMSHEALCVDGDPDNADWTKQTWDLPPYKSEESMRFLARSGETLDDFRRLPVYRFAVLKGIIKDDEWIGGAAPDSVIILSDGRQITHCKERLLRFIQFDAYEVYDYWGGYCQQPANMINRRHVYASNAAMLARSPINAWDNLIHSHTTQLTEGLLAIPAGLDLIDASDDAVRRGKMPSTSSSKRSRMGGDLRTWRRARFYTCCGQGSSRSPTDTSARLLVSLRIPALIRPTRRATAPRAFLRSRTRCERSGIPIRRP
ncbi:MAG: hypothetical protein M0Z94_12205 [Dehalococcoidales bacterium]|nr:hypothetical protein [Dehalococcoidales bacterium]